MVNNKQKDDVQQVKILFLAHEIDLSDNFGSWIMDKFDVKDDIPYFLHFSFEISNSHYI